MRVFLALLLLLAAAWAAPLPRRTLAGYVTKDGDTPTATAPPPPGAGSTWAAYVPGEAGGSPPSWAGFVPGGAAIGADEAGVAAPGRRRRQQ